MTRCKPIYDVRPLKYFRPSDSHVCVLSFYDDENLMLFKIYDDDCVYFEDCEAVPSSGDFLDVRHINYFEYDYDKSNDIYRFAFNGDLYHVYDDYVIKEDL